MPLIYESSYTKRPFLLFNSYLETLYPFLTTKVHQIPYDREKLELEDGDFLDLDWVTNSSDTLVIFSHAFEGNSKDHFIEKSVSYLTKKGYDSLVWHYRSCGGELNRLPRLYSQGDIQDLNAVVNYAIEKKSYKQIILVGFSMGGSIVINYLGSDLVHPNIKGSIVFSTPLDLKSASQKLTKGLNWFIHQNFLAKMKKKLKRKAAQFPDHYQLDRLKTIKNLSALSEQFILPLLGFPTMDDYAEKWSSHQFLPKIKVPLLIVNAKNDPILSENCFPYEACEKSEFVHLETPKFGGHTGFSKKVNGELWYVKRVWEFID